MHFCGSGQSHENVKKKKLSQEDLVNYIAKNPDLAC